MPLPPYNKIANFEASDYKDLSKQLVSFQRTIGITTLLGDDEIDFIIDHLCDNFSDFNAIEIKLAYGLAVSSTIPVPEKHLEHYDALTAQYLTRLLVPYRQYRAKLLNLHADEEIKFVTKADVSTKPLPTPEQQLQKDKQFCIAAFNTFTETKLSFGLHKIYDILYKYNLLTFTDDRKAAFKQKAIERLKYKAKQDTRVKTVMQAFEKGATIGTTTVIQEAKKVATEVLFTEMFETGTGPELLFENVAIVTP